MPVFGYCQENHIRLTRRCSSAVPARSCSAPLGNSVLHTDFSSSPPCLTKALFIEHIGFIPHINSKSDSFHSFVLLPFLHRAGARCFDAVDIIYLNSCCNTNHLSQVEPGCVNSAQGTYPGDFYGRCSVYCFTVSNLSSG